MSSNEDEQLQEVEALEAIYPDEFTVLTQEPLEWNIKIVPHPDGSEENHVSVHLCCRPGATYPDTTPEELKLDMANGLAQKQVEELLQIVEDTAAQNIGMVCGYMLTEAVREWLVENNVTQIDNSMHASMMRRMDKKEKNDKQELVDSDSRTDDSAARRDFAEDEDLALERRRKAEGTPVNEETFAAWLASFLREYPDSMEMEVSKTKKLTGKQMFMQHIAGTEDGLDENAVEEDEAEARAQKEALLVNQEDLFLVEEDDDDLDLDSDEDDVEFDDSDEDDKDA